MRIALATNEEYPVLVDGEILLLEAFKNAGYDVSPAVWSDHEIDWKHFDHVIIRSCWDYHQEIEQFYAWLDKLQVCGVRVHNAPEIVKWNSHKQYLIDLQDLGLPTPQTVLVKRGDQRPLRDITAKIDGEQFVIKPCYGASSEGVTLASKGSLDHADDEYRELLRTSDVLLQEFMPDVEKGEISAIFLNNSFSHAVLKIPKRGEFRTNHSRGGTEKALRVSSEQANQINELYRLCDKDVLYARLDLVDTARGLCLMELELIEPYLFFDFENSSAQRFIRAFEQRIVR